MAEEGGNQLFPVFIKLNELKVLQIGGGNVGLEKLHALLSNSPECQIHLVAEHVLPELERFAAAYPQVTISRRKFIEDDLTGRDLVLIATGDNLFNAQVRALARERHLLINVADKPGLCDFYLGSVVKKGDLKIGISTNGKSPTIAKRLKEVFNESLPSGLEQTLTQMNLLRETLSGDFAHKVEELNRATEVLVRPANRHRNTKRNWLLWGAGGAALVLASWWLISS